MKKKYSFIIFISIIAIIIFIVLLNIIFINKNNEKGENLLQDKINKAEIKTEEKVDYKKVIEDYYNIAFKLYQLSTDYFIVDTENPITIKGDYYYQNINAFEIKNYDLITEKYFTDDEKESFEKNCKYLYIKDGKKYRLDYTESTYSLEHFEIESLKNYEDEIEATITTGTDEYSTIKVKKIDSNTYKILNYSNENIIPLKNKTELEKYLYNIYIDLHEMPVFKSIKEADTEWIYSVVYYRETKEMTEEELNNSAKRIFGNDVKKFPSLQYKKIGFQKVEEKFEYTNAIWDDYYPYFYKIKNIKVNNNIYEVEIVEACLEHEYVEKINAFKYYLKNLNGKVLAEFVDGADKEKEPSDKNIEGIFNKNIEEMNSKLLKIEYDKTNKQYHMISSIKKQ